MVLTYGRTESLDQVERERRRVRSRRLIIGFFVFIGCIVFLESPLTRVRSFQVTGNRSIPSYRILSESGLEKGMSLWQVNGQAVEHSITQHEPLVDSVVTTTDIIRGQVTVSVHEKHVVAVFIASGKYYLMLNDGVIYQETSAVGGFPWPIITADAGIKPIVGQRLNNLFVSTVAQQLTGLSPSFSSSVSELHVDQYGVLTIFLTNGYEVQCKATDFNSTVSSMSDVIHYFAGKGYAPGIIDMTGQPPYRYTPFQNNAKQQGGNP